jgi:hypothetical protein
MFGRSIKKKNTYHRMQEWPHNLLVHKILQMAVNEVSTLDSLNFVFIICVYLIEGFTDMHQLCGGMDSNCLWEHRVRDHVKKVINLIRGMASSGMLCRVTLVRTEVLEELSASIIRVTRIGELGTIAVTSNRCKMRRNTKFL